MPRKNIRRRQAQMHLWLDKPILKRLQEIAKKEGRTATELCREAIADLLLKRDIKEIIKNKGVNTFLSWLYLYVPLIQLQLQDQRRP